MMCLCEGIMHVMLIRVGVCLDFVLCAYVSARCVVSVPRDVVLVGWICGGFLSRMTAACVQASPACTRSGARE